jgi:hypothetical protein
MKRLVSVVAIALLTLLAVNALAAGHPASTSGKTVTLKGEVVCLGCYLGHGAKGADHKACATKCLAEGMPFGLLTAEGKLYLLTMNHDDPDAFNKCKTLAAETVAVSGTMVQRNGMTAVDVTGVKSAK